MSVPPRLCPIKIRGFLVWEMMFSAAEIHSSAFGFSVFGRDGCQTRWPFFSRRSVSQGIQTLSPVQPRPWKITISSFMRLYYMKITKFEERLTFASSIV